MSTPESRPDDYRGSSPPLQPPPQRLATTTSGQDDAPSQPQTFYDRIGGEPTFRRLGSRFYELVAADEILRPVYPDDNLDAAEEHLVLFLMQYWGGPSTYSQHRGHPRLRMRHRPFAIGPAERDAWLANMRTALDDLELAEADDAVLWEYLVRAAFSLQNSE